MRSRQAPRPFIIVYRSKAFFSSSATLSPPPSSPTPSCPLPMAPLRDTPNTRWSLLGVASAFLHFQRSTGLSRRSHRPSIYGKESSLSSPWLNSAPFFRPLPIATPPSSVALSLALVVFCCGFPRNCFVISDLYSPRPWKPGVRLHSCEDQRVRPTPVSPPHYRSAFAVSSCSNSVVIFLSLEKQKFILLLIFFYAFFFRILYQVLRLHIR